MARGGNVRNVTRGRRGYMDSLFGQAFDIVMQWMQLATQAMQKEMYMLRRIRGAIVPGGNAGIWSLAREMEFMRIVLGGYGDYGFGRTGRGYYGPGFGWTGTSVYLQYSDLF